MAEYFLVADFSFAEIPFRPVLIYSLIGTAVVLIGSAIYVNSHPRDLATAASRSWISKFIYFAFIANIDKLPKTLQADFGTLVRDAKSRAKLIFSTREDLESRVSKETFDDSLSVEVNIDRKTGSLNKI